MLERVKQHAALVRPLLRPLLVPFLLYIGLLAVSRSYLQAHPENIAVFSLIPMILAIYLAISTIREISKLDEMEKRIFLEAASFSFVLTFLIMLYMGLLGMVEITQLDGTYIALMMAVLLVIGILWGNWRYR